MRWTGFRHPHRRDDSFGRFYSPPHGQRLHFATRRRRPSARCNSAGAGQGCQDGPVWPGKAWTGDLSAQHRDLLPEHEELGVLGGLPASEQFEPAQD